MDSSGNLKPKRGSGAEGTTHTTTSSVTSEAPGTFQIHAVAFGPVLIKTNLLLEGAQAPDGKASSLNQDEKEEGTADQVAEERQEEVDAEREEKQDTPEKEDREQDELEAALARAEEVEKQKAEERRLEEEEARQQEEQKERRNFGGRDAVG